MFFVFVRIRCKQKNVSNYLTFETEQTDLKKNHNLIKVAARTDNIYKSYVYWTVHHLDG